MKTKTRVVPYGFDSQISFNFNVQLILITDFGRGNQFNTIFFFSNIIFNQKKKKYVIRVPMNFRLKTKKQSCLRMCALIFLSLSE